jgi:fructose-1,6-bisphosphatase
VHPGSSNIDAAISVNTIFSIYQGHLFRAKREQLTRFRRLLPPSQGQNLALTGLIVPSSFENGQNLALTGLFVPSCLKPLTVRAGSSNIDAAIYVGFTFGIYKAMNSTPHNHLNH